jgi:short-subunit dehydrogenase
MVENKTILLTGASGGIGAEIAKLLSAHGATLILVGLSQAELDDLNKQLGDKHYVIEADISTELGRNTILSSCQQYQDMIDIVVNIAGIGQFSLFSDLDEDRIAAIININLTSTILLTQTLLPLLLSRPQAQIVNIGSILGSIGFPGSSVYCASKFGIRGFSEALRRELLDTSVSVRYFAPRATKTAINDDKVVAMNAELGTKMDNAADVAQQLLDFLTAENATKYLGWPEKLFVRINSLLPSVVEKSIYKQLPIIKRYLQGH